MVDVRIDWTVEQAVAAGREAAKNGIPLSDPAGPICQWVALHTLKELEEKYQKGNEFALMQSVAECARAKLVIPDWAALAFHRRYDSVVSARAGSWDEAFGRPFPKGAHLGKVRRHQVLRFQIYVRVIEIRKRKPYVPIDEHLFEMVGKEFGVSRSVANKLYYEAKRMMESGLPRKSRNSRQ